MSHPSHLPIYAPCSTCGVTTVGRKYWRRAQRQLAPLGIRPRRGTQCAACNRRSLRRAEAEAEGRQYWPKSPGETRPKISLEVVLQEWAHLADPELSIAANCRLLAPRLGMRWRSLEKALGRARQGAAA